MKLRWINHFLTVLVIALAGYLMYQPLAPAAGYWVRHQAPVISKPATVALPPQPPNENTLFIPSLGLERIVYEGATKSALQKGVWHRPQTSSPNRGGNTVLAGHRFTYTDPAVFYHLDKVKIGDEIILFWNQKRYVYKVSVTKVVAPTAVDVENPSNESRLTLYTCTPLWSSAQRLVVIADLKDES